ncbi:MAG: S-methyl-5-thioribose-1-phosphate isomerase [Candidatus Omnitrophica bacterium]|nr:S-methyl-5-thioribose-1-phosphate isomerase [Candidatus Omnitrophota bacterium]
MKLMTIAWRRNKIRIIDQTKLPAKLAYRDIGDLGALWQAIRKMQVRGAPALGAAAALGAYLGVKDVKAKTFPEFKKRLDECVAFIGSSRPTARNLFWGLERMQKEALKNKDKSIPALKKILFAEALKIISEDQIACRRIGKIGSRLIKKGDSIMTVCNAGVLATIDYGTALGVIYRAEKQGKRVKVYACETRPLLQGARLTVWELMRKGVDVTLNCDNMAAALMAQGKVDKVIAGADRIAANGDTANKIGTYSLAVLAQHHKIPFYIAAPLSTFDISIKSGKGIPIEQRAREEVTSARRVKVFNPAFDVTPHQLITAIITDKGIIRPPYIRNIKKLISNDKLKMSK